MKLKELIEQATPLPWDKLPQFPTPEINWVTVVESHNKLLALHAVNMLPKLVEALQDIVNDFVEHSQGNTERSGDEIAKDFADHARAALAEANNPEVSK